MDNIVWEEKASFTDTQQWVGKLRTSQITEGRWFLIYIDSAKHKGQTRAMYRLRVKLPGVANEQRPSVTLEAAKALAEKVLKHWLQRSGLCFNKASQQEGQAEQK